MARIGNLIKKFFEKNLKFSEEVLNDLQNCLSHTVYVNAKLFSLSYNHLYTSEFIYFQDQIKEDLQNFRANYRSFDQIDPEYSKGQLRVYCSPNGKGQHSCSSISRIFLKRL